jgi:predicted GIY-YIG superfamily endonuclease
VRLQYHKTLEKGFTSRYRPWEIKFKKEFADKIMAAAAEKKIKSWKSSVMIEKLISGKIRFSIRLLSRRSRDAGLSPASKSYSNKFKLGGVSKWSTIFTSSNQLIMINTTPAYPKILK